MTRHINRAYLMNFKKAMIYFMVFLMLIIRKYIDILTS